MLSETARLYESIRDEAEFQTLESFIGRALAAVKAFDDFVSQVKDPAVACGGTAGEGVPGIEVT